MKRILFILFLVISFQSFAQNRFPSIDSAKNYTLRYYRNSTVETFSNLRGQNIAYGTLELIDSLAGNGAVDSIWFTGGSPDTLRYRKAGTTYTVGTISGGGGGSGTVTNFSFTNSTGITGTVTNPTTTPNLSLVIDSGAIANFSSKVRSLVSATYPIQYTSGTGVFSLDTSSGKWRSEGYYNTVFLKNITGLVTQGWNTKLTGSGTGGSPYVISVDTTTQTLTDGATITFNANSGVSARVVIGGNRTLAFSNFHNGMFLSLAVIQDGTGGHTLTLPASTKVINSGAGSVTLTTAANSHDILTFWKINDVIYCNYGKNYN